MATCFDNIIGLRNSCDTTVPTSGFYIDDLGIDIRFLNDIVTQGYENGEDLFDSKVGFARQLLINNIRTHFAKKFRTRSILDGQRIGFNQDNLQIVSGEAKYRGIEIEMCNKNTYVDFFLSRIDFFGNHTGNISLLVFDLLQGRQIDSITIPAVAGETITVFPNKTYTSERQKLHLYFAYDATGIDTYQVQLGQAGCTSCGSSGTIALNPYLTAGARSLGLAESVVDENLVGIGDTGGLSFLYSVNCNHEDWLCEKSNLLAMSLLYKTASEIISHALTNYEQISNAQLVHYDKLVERKAELENMYMEQLDSVLKTLTIPNDNICFLCNSPVRHVIALP